MDNTARVEDNATQAQGAEDNYQSEVGEKEETKEDDSESGQRDEVTQRILKIMANFLEGEVCTHCDTFVAFFL